LPGRSDGAPGAPTPCSTSGHQIDRGSVWRERDADRSRVADPRIQKITRVADHGFKITRDAITFESHGRGSRFKITRVADHTDSKDHTGRGSHGFKKSHGTQITRIQKITTRIHRSAETQIIRIRAIRDP
jgi:hypothetical protein